MSEQTSCEVTITWKDAKKKKIMYRCDRYFVKEGVIALETRSFDNGQLATVQTIGIPLDIIASYDALYRVKQVAVDEKEGNE